jgi:hypothetical protein
MTRKRGRDKGCIKTGGATKGSVKTQTLAVKAAVLRVFEDVNKDDEYLYKLAEEDRPLFMSLVAKFIPTSTHADIDINSVHTVDLTEAFRLAQERIDALGPRDEPPMVDITPTPEPEPMLVNPAKGSSTAWPGYDY